MTVLNTYILYKQNGEMKPEFAKTSKNLLNVKSDSTLRKLKSETSRQLDRSKDDMTDIMMMLKDHPEYIKEISIPFNIKLYSIEQINVMKSEKCGDVLPIIYFDATGGVTEAESAPKFLIDVNNILKSQSHLPDTLNRGGGVHLRTSVVIRIRVGSMSLFVIESGCMHSSYSKMDDKYREQWMRWYEECESEDESRHDPYSTDDSIADPEYMQQDSDSCTDLEYENIPNNDEPGTSRKKRKRKEPKSKVDLPSGHVDSEGSDDIDVLLDPDNDEQKWEDNIIDCLEFSFDSISVGVKEQLADKPPIEESKMPKV
ncbi:unnamed protein product [Acanthoscelides obtectus]|uniref:Uncharacterized protein n=1 Tax=Acanthoscelides obtectus TaxID=200917 RepID=A0A9P0LHR4_ACAOB|nr:unnamed protein product [Acanthoscelides obtectus]CAK1633642.1 hypothetical protein AOBTE_LOCUS8282 [Acanthoscelides obtectus]